MREHINDTIYNIKELREGKELIARKEITFIFLN